VCHQAAAEDWGSIYPAAVAGWQAFQHPEDKEAQTEEMAIPFAAIFSLYWSLMVVVG
jgi:hypothetical protein